MMAAPVNAPNQENNDSLTVLLAINGTTSKQIVASNGQIEIKGYNAGIWFGVLTYTVNSIASLYAKVAMLARQNNVVVIRGDPSPGIDRSLRAVRRLKVNFPSPPHGRRWIMIDFDKIALPPGLNLVNDLEAALEYLVGLLPPEFRNVTYCWQLSASAGVSDPSVASAHVWFWLNRPVPDVELRNWANTWNSKAGMKIIDPALFNAVQLHYITTPHFKGIPDPLPNRCGLQCKDTDEAVIALPSLTTGKVRGMSSAGIGAKGRVGLSRPFRRQRGRRRLGWVPQAESGERNTMLTKLAGHLIARGLPLDAVLGRAKKWNSKNKVPLDDHEVTTTCESVWRTHQRNHA